MKNNELNEFAKQFITSWQENFSKAMSDQQIATQMMQTFSNMQQFYEKSSTPAFSNPFEFGTNQPSGGEYASRIDDLESRIAALEESLARRDQPIKPTNKKRKSK